MIHFIINKRFADKSYETINHFTNFYKRFVDDQAYCSINQFTGIGYNFVARMNKNACYSQRLFYYTSHCFGGAVLTGIFLTITRKKLSKKYLEPKIAIYGLLGLICSLNAYFHIMFREYEPNHQPSGTCNL